MATITKPNEFLLYTTPDGEVRVEVLFNDENIWLSQKIIAQLFDVDVRTVNEHLKNIFKDMELEENSVIRKFRITASDGKQYETNHYNLDAIISVGYRVNSAKATQFRIWATKRLREYIVKGFTLNDERFKSGKSVNYFDELQSRIREIRLSEKLFYQKIKDIYTTSIDYDKDASQTQKFFKIVQNKLIWAISKQTAAELVHSRVNAEKPMLGMQSFDQKSPTRITKQHAFTSKNYLEENEIKLLGLIVEQYLAFAETMANQQTPMYMKDWIEQLDSILKMNKRELLDHAGKISRKQMEEKVEDEFKKFQGKLRLEEKVQSLKELEADLAELSKK